MVRYDHILATISVGSSEFMIPLSEHGNLILEGLLACYVLHISDRDIKSAPSNIQFGMFLVPFVVIECVAIVGKRSTFRGRRSRVTFRASTAHLKENME